MRLASALLGVLGMLVLVSPVGAQGLSRIQTKDGGMIVFGPVSGAVTQPAAMAKILRNVHENCGDKPVLGKVFRYKNTPFYGVFFTVTNKPGGNKKVAGLVLAAQTGPQTVEAALVSDAAGQFGRSVNPMLNQLFKAWHPSGSQQQQVGQSGGSALAGHGSAPAAPLRAVVLQDRSSQVGIPEGWRIYPNSGGGTTVLTGPHEEVIQLNASFLAIDPRDPGVQQPRMMAQRYGRGPDNRIYYPYGVNLPKAFVDLYNLSDRNQNIPPTSFRITSSQQVPNQPCANVSGTAVRSENRKNYELTAVFCEARPVSGMWLSTAYVILLPTEVADRERETALAVLRSYRVNQAVVNQQANTMAAPTIAAIHEIGRQADIRYQATQQSNDAQHAQYWQQQESNARLSKQRSDFMLDQTVIQDNNMYNNGTVGHGTVWNSTADALVKADPDRYEIVDRPGYWKGTDF